MISVSIYNRDRKQEKPHDRIIRNTIRLPPRTHNPHVIEGNDGNDVHAFAFQRGFVGDVAREVLGAAAGGEGARDGDEDDFFIGPFCFVALVALGG